MRLGCNWRPVSRESDLEDLLGLLDELGLGAIGAPSELPEWTIEECERYGELVRDYGLTVGEFGYWENLLVPDDDLRDERIEELRAILRRADAMQVDCVVSLVGSRDADGWAGSPHPDNWTDAFREAARENCRRVLDGLDLEHTTYALEPWVNTFFHRPRPVSEFLDSVDDPRLGVHMDVMNMHTVETCYRSSEVIEEAFDLLADDVAAVHAKDLNWREDGHVVTLEEVLPGEGTLDYDRYLQRLDDLDDDLAVFTEHWDTDEEFERTMRYLNDVAERNEIEVVRRGG